MVGKNKAELIVYPKKQDAFESEGATVNNDQDDWRDGALSLTVMLSPSKGHERSTGPTGRQTGAVTSAYMDFEDLVCTRGQLPNKQAWDLMLRREGGDGGLDRGPQPRRGWGWGVESSRWLRSLG